MLSSLTQKQKEVLHLCAQGLCNEQICDILKIEPSTLRTHLGNIYLSLGLYKTEQNRVKAILMYLADNKKLTKQWINVIKRSLANGSYEPYPLSAAKRGGAPQHHAPCNN